MVPAKNILSFVFNCNLHATLVSAKLIKLHLKTLKLRKGLFLYLHDLIDGYVEWVRHLNEQTLKEILSNMP